MSIGYLIEEERVGEDGVRELLAVDLIEVSLTASPSNDGTKILATKSLRPPVQIYTFEI